MKNHGKVQTQRFDLPPHHKCLLQPDALPDKKRQKYINCKTNKQINAQMNKTSVYVLTVFCACQVKIRKQTNNDLSEPGKSIKIWCKVEGNKIKQQKKEN